jgi:hypothetical protein
MNIQDQKTDIGSGCRLEGGWITSLNKSFVNYKNLCLWSSVSMLHLSRVLYNLGNPLLVPAGKNHRNLASLTARHITDNT